jgi:hypothetical protein
MRTVLYLLAALVVLTLTMLVIAPAQWAASSVRSATSGRVDLAEARGPFPAIEGSIYDMDNMTWTPPQSLVSYDNDWGRPAFQWDTIVNEIKKHGIRNAAQTTVAPTGTIATVAGCEGYGCEPVFALAYFRHVNDNGQDLKLTYASPRFDEALKKLGLGEEKRQEIVSRSCGRVHVRTSMIFHSQCGIRSSSRRISQPRNTSACKPRCKPSWIILSRRPSTSLSPLRKRMLLKRICWPGNLAAKGLPCM